MAFQEEMYRKSVVTLMNQHSDNKVCFDCGVTEPRWVSMNFGVFICIKCSGGHRRCGFRTKSVDLDKWSAKDLEFLKGVGNVKQLYYIDSPPPQDYQSAATETWIQRKYLKKPEEPPKDKFGSPDRSIGNNSPRGPAYTNPAFQEEMVYLPAPQRSRSSSVGSRFESPRGRSVSRPETPPPSSNVFIPIAAAAQVQQQMMGRASPTPLQAVPVVAVPSGRASPAPNPFVNAGNSEPLTPTIGNVALKAGIMSLYQPPLQPQPVQPPPVSQPQPTQHPPFVGPNYNVVVNNPFETHSTFGLIHPHVIQPKVNTPPQPPPQQTYFPPVYTVAVQPQVVYVPVVQVTPPPPNLNNSSLI